MASLIETSAPEVQEQQQDLKPTVMRREPAPLSALPREYRVMFSDSLLESGSPEKKRRTWTTILSFSFQCALIGTLVIVPLIFTEALPKAQLLTFLVAPPPPPPPPPPAAAQVQKVVRQIQTDLLNTGQLRDWK